MDSPWEPSLDDAFDDAIDEALNSMPSDIRAAVRNVAIVVEDEPPDGQRLGQYSGVPRGFRAWGLGAVGVLPSKVSLFRGPITRIAAGDDDRLRREVKRVLLEELAHHFAAT